MPMMIMNSTLKSADVNEIFFSIQAFAATRLWGLYIDTQREENKYILTNWLEHKWSRAQRHFVGGMGARVHLNSAAVALQLIN